MKSKKRNRDQKTKNEIGKQRKTKSESKRLSEYQKLKKWRIGVLGREREREREIPKIKKMENRCSRGEREREREREREIYLLLQEVAMTFFFRRVKPRESGREKKKEWGREKRREKAKINSNIIILIYRL